ncbi:MAG: hypothetical protein ONB44_17090 [candidate division KSB1 bacterium]|nr:hypothetical protein [candidate division KSB1 bacterium]MDZ7303851.1 hypothetical protein [candidate division KSB1 bacterium]MDZ7312752.1 hypothetical protein [candidate division KSB1 bacterium]
MPAPARLALLYSAPLVWQDESGALQPIDRLDFKTERDWLFESFNDAGRAVEVRLEAATAENLQKLVLLGCRALHYSGHGHPEALAFDSVPKGAWPNRDPLTG